MCRCSVPRGWDPGVIWPGHRRHSTLIFYLSFIPPSPWDEAGQDKRNPIQSLFLEDFLPAASGWWWRGQSTILQYAPPKLKISTHFIKVLAEDWTTQNFIIFFQPCWAWIPFTVFPDRMYHHDLQSWDQSKKMLTWIGHSIYCWKACRIPSGLHSAEGRKWWGFGQWCEQWCDFFCDQC